MGSHRQTMRQAETGHQLRCPTGVDLNQDIELETSQHQMDCAPTMERDARAAIAPA
jgi:hypothetical protein